MVLPLRRQIHFIANRNLHPEFRINTPGAFCLRLFILKACAYKLEQLVPAELEQI